MICLTVVLWCYCNPFYRCLGWKSEQLHTHSWIFHDGSLLLFGQHSHPHEHNLAHSTTRTQMLTHSHTHTRTQSSSFKHMHTRLHSHAHQHPFTPFSESLSPAGTFIFSPEETQLHDTADGIWTLDFSEIQPIFWLNLTSISTKAVAN